MLPAPLFFQEEPSGPLVGGLASAPSPHAAPARLPPRCVPKEKRPLLLRLRGRAEHKEARRHYQHG